MSFPWCWFTFRRNSRIARRREKQPGSGRARPFTRLGLEELESRLAPSAVSWTGAAGDLNWGTAANWSPVGVPASTDDVTISVAVTGTINISSASDAVRSLNDTTAALSIASGGTLSLAAVAATSTFGQNTTIQSGGALTVGARSQR